MKKPYLLLSIIGFVVPNILVTMESVETGNVLLYANPAATIEAMFSNRISSIFMIDLLFTVLVFFIWSYRDARQNRMKGLAWIWSLTLVLGLAGALPLFLHLKEKTRAK